MRYVRFHPDDLDVEKFSDAEKEELRSWLKKAEAATRKAVEDYEKNGTPSEEDAAIWKDHKRWLLRNKFDYKCAYCEKSMSDIPTDAEHWRPKRKITGVGDHPGYFWLAYSWRNLLPACSMCNSYDGKKNQFPVSNGYVFRRKLTDAQLSQLRCPHEAISSGVEADLYYLGAEDLDALEGPLLLHPYVDENPALDHLEFGKCGRVNHRSTKGEFSIKVFNLNREALLKERESVEFRQRIALLASFCDRRQIWDQRWQEALDEAEAYCQQNIDERKPYSAAARAALTRAVEEERKRWAEAATVASDDD
jgi:hypothetical protein